MLGQYLQEYLQYTNLKTNSLGAGSLRVWHRAALAAFQESLLSTLCYTNTCWAVVDGLAGVLT